MQYISEEPIHILSARQYYSCYLRNLLSYFLPKYTKFYSKIPHISIASVNFLILRFCNKNMSNEYYFTSLSIVIISIDLLKKLQNYPIPFLKFFFYTCTILNIYRETWIFFIYFIKTFLLFIFHKKPRTTHRKGNFFNNIIGVKKKSIFLPIFPKL